MEQEKRKLGDYTELASFCIGKYEIGLLENQNAQEGEMFLCGFIESNGIFERLTDGHGQRQLCGYSHCLRREDR